MFFFSSENAIAYMSAYSQVLKDYEEELSFQLPDILSIYKKSVVNDNIRKESPQSSWSFGLWCDARTTLRPGGVIPLIDQLREKRLCVALFFHYYQSPKPMLFSRFLKPGHSLRILHISGCVFPLFEFKRFCSLIALDDVLEALTLSLLQKFNADDFSFLCEAIGQNMRLEYLDISSNCIKMSQLTQLLEAINLNQCSQLSKLKINGNTKFIEDQTSFWRAIASNTSITSLWARDCWTGDLAMRYISQRISKGFGFKLIDLRGKSTLTFGGISSLFDALENSYKRVLRGFEEISVGDPEPSFAILERIVQFVNSPAFSSMFSKCFDHFPQIFFSHDVIRKSDRLGLSDSLLDPYWDYNLARSESTLDVAESKVRAGNVLSARDIPCVLKFVKKIMYPIHSISFAYIDLSKCEKDIIGILSHVKGTITCVDLTKCSLQYPYSKVLDFLSMLPNLSALSLSFNEISAVQPEKVTSVGKASKRTEKFHVFPLNKLRSLKSLNLSFCDLSGPGGILLLKQVQEMSIQHLNVSNCGLDDNSYVCIADFINSSHSITSINFGNVNNALAPVQSSKWKNNEDIGHECCKKLVTAFSSNKTLKEILIQNVQFFHYPIELLESICINPRIEFVYFDLASNDDCGFGSIDMNLYLQESLLYVCKGISFSEKDWICMRNFERGQRLTLFNFVDKCLKPSMRMRFDKRILPMIASYIPFHFDPGDCGLDDAALAVLQRKKFEESLNEKTLLQQLGRMMHEAE